jgi:hypothetical protein
MNPQAFAILVAGMHRSGTSATAGALQHLGIALGEQLMVGGDDNPKGYFEHEGVVGVHDELLRELGSWWSDPRPLPEGWLATPAARRAEEALVRIIRRDFAGSPVWAVKDPRACRLLPLWSRCLDRLGIASGVLHVVRSPGEVAASLRARNGFSTALGELLWLRHVTTAISDSRGVARGVVMYESLLADPPGSIAQALAAMGVPTRTDAAASSEALGSFVDASFRHHRDVRSASATRVGALAAEVFAAFAALDAGDAEWAALDALCERFDMQWAEMEPFVGAVAESVFPALDDRARIEADLHVTRSQLNAQINWSEQAVVEHRAVAESRDALADQANEAALALQAAQAEQARLASDLAAQVRWAEQAVVEHRAVVESRDALAARANEAALALQAAQAEQARLSSDLDAQVRWAEEAVILHRTVIEERDALTGQLNESALALQAAQSDLARVASDLAAQVRWAEEAVLQHRSTIEHRDALALQVAEQRDALTVQARELAVAQAGIEHARDELAKLRREAELSSNELRAATDARDALRIAAAELQAVRDALQTELATVRAELAARWEVAGRVDAELAGVRTEAKRLEQEIAAMRNTVTWRWTAPLRNLRGKAGAAAPEPSPNRDSGKENNP